MGAAVPSPPASSANRTTARPACTWWKIRRRLPDFPQSAYPIVSASVSTAGWGSSPVAARGDWSRDLHRAKRGRCGSRRSRGLLWRVVLQRWGECPVLVAPSFGVGEARRPRSGFGWGRDRGGVAPAAVVSRCSRRTGSGASRKRPSHRLPVVRGGPGFPAAVVLLLALDRSRIAVSGSTVWPQVDLHLRHDLHGPQRPRAGKLAETSARPIRGRPAENRCDSRGPLTRQTLGSPTPAASRRPTGPARIRVSPRSGTRPA
jgi:hypothetical protein